MKRLIKRFLPGSIQSFSRRLYYRYPIIRRLYYFPINIWETIRGKRDKLVPPRSMIFVGDGNFESIGNEFLEYYIRFCGLQRDAKVLEVGSGIGRMAIPLTQYLDSRGSYSGMDIVPEGIEWCQKKITPRYPNFTFILSDIFNEQYNSKGKLRAIDYRFPYENDSFDFIFLTSVFTHMLRADIDHYLEEISRVLKEGGKCLITYFLLNDDARICLKSKENRFKYTFEDCMVIDPQMPEASIAHPENEIRNIYEKWGLKILDPIHYGDWCGRKTFVSSQDMVIAQKTSGSNTH